MPRLLLFIKMIYLFKGKREETMTWLFDSSFFMWMRVSEAVRRGGVRRDAFCWKYRPQSSLSCQQSSYLSPPASSPPKTTLLLASLLCPMPLVTSKISSFLISFIPSIPPGLEDFPHCPFVSSHKPASSAPYGVSYHHRAPGRSLSHLFLMS